MRYIDGETYYTVSEVAEAVGVSAQTVRVWGRQGGITTRRTPGGHRLFDESALEHVRERAVRSRRRSTAEPQFAGTDTNVTDWEVAATGARIRSQRESAGLTQKELAETAGISRSLLSAIERGETGVSMTVFSRIAQSLALPMSELAPPTLTSQLLVTADQRPRTTLGNGVTWEELAAPGHTMMPAIMYAAAGAASGGYVLNSRETWFMMLDGRLRVRTGEPSAETTLTSGDSLMLPAGQLYAWENSDDIQATVLVVEHQSS